MIYIVITILAVMLGQVCKHLCIKFPPVVAEEITYPQFFRSLKKDFKLDIKYSIIFAIFFNSLYYTNNSIIMTLICSLIIFSLMIVFSVDYRFELIPDECSLFIGYVSLISIIIFKGNIIDSIVGAIIGGGIFYLLGKLAIIIFKKEGMGFGDVKLMFVLGLFFGIKDIIVITLVSFFLGAIISCIIMLFRKQGLDSYIPFGPFIVIAAILLMYFDSQIFIDMYFNLCMGLSNFVTDFIFNLITK